MQIDDVLDSNGSQYRLEYHDADSFDDLPTELCTQSYGLCFVKDKLVIGFGGNKHAWGLIGGTIEKGETFRQAFDREIVEESNMKVLDAKPVGYQKVTDPSDKTIYQLRYWARVEPIGEFLHDPGGGITEIKLIDPKDYKDYFDWGRIGEHLIHRAIEINSQSKE